MEHNGFCIDSLIGDQTNTDGEKIYEAIEKNLKRALVAKKSLDFFGLLSHPKNSFKIVGSEII
jgi:hypothetical protein